jgi:hypothetical protein
MDDDPERNRNRKRIRTPGADIRDIMGNETVMKRIRSNLTVQDQANARLTDLRFNQAFKVTFENFITTKWPIDFARIREFMATTAFELWAAGSSVLQAVLIQNGTLRNIPEWASSDLDLYVAIPQGYRLGPGGIAIRGVNNFVQGFTGLLEQMGFQMTKHFEQQQNTREEEEEHTQNIMYSGGFMRLNHIEDIYTFTHANGKDIQLVVVGDNNGGHGYTVPMVINRFDLTVCSVGYNFQRNEIYYAPDAPADIEAGRMTLRPAYMVKYSQGNYIIHKRIAKYTARGFTLTNAPKLTLIILNLSRAIRRMKFRISQYEDMIQDYFFENEYLRLTGLARRDYEYRISLRKYINGRQTVMRFESKIEKNRNSIMFLEARKAEIEAGNLSSIIYTRPKLRIQARIDQMQYDISRSEELVSRPEDENDISFMATSQRLPNVPAGAAKNDPARKARHQFNLDRRVYNSARFKREVCSNEADPYTLSDLGEIFERYKVFKRVSYRDRPDRNGDDSETEDVEDPADLPYTVLCYDITQLWADIRRLRQANQPLKWPETRLPISPYDEYRITQQHTRYKDYLHVVDLRERKEKLEQSLVDIERGTYWQRKLIGGKTKSMSFRKKSPRKSPRKSRKVQSARRQKSPRRSPRKSRKRSPRKRRD